jgi:hypothetical protein
MPPVDESNRYSAAFFQRWVSGRFGQRVDPHELEASWPVVRRQRRAPPVVISHVRAVHRAQRYPSCIGNLRLRHPAFAQQHHLDSLPDLRIFLALERSLQPRHLVSVAFDHLRPRPESDGLKRIIF